MLVAVSVGRVIGLNRVVRHCDRSCSIGSVVGVAVAMDHLTVFRAARVLHQQEVAERHRLGGDTNRSDQVRRVVADSRHAAVDTTGIAAKPATLTIDAYQRPRPLGSGGFALSGSSGQLCLG